MQLVVATTNQHKLDEYRAIFADLPYDLRSLRDLNITDDVAETGTTFAANAQLKAEAYALQTGYLTLADDSGLEVKALGGRPGVFSARYGGPGTTPAEQHRLLLSELADVPWEQRMARFVCVIALAQPGHPTQLVRGTLPGMIAREPRGTHGFGYDPLFWLPDHGCTLAELDPTEKNRISHRAEAARHARHVLAQWPRENVAT